MALTLTREQNWLKTNPLKKKNGYFFQIPKPFHLAAVRRILEKGRSSAGDQICYFQCCLMSAWSICWTAT